ncbi:MAG: YggS family pyridoxal phosphate-dependent enzyme [Gammaproteobacteria bacterium]|nr:YggS family pyridoxal phosphate-dependent enzyme [Gammaproteobacteria bacterium]
MIDYSSLPSCLSRVHRDIENICRQTERKRETVKLLAVSKKHAHESIQIAFEHGQRDFGENYLSEALEKQKILSDLDICWHYIGSIQSNKTKKMAENFDWIHTVDSFKIAKRLSEQRPKNLAKLNICLQINIDNEESKSGISPDIDNLISLTNQVKSLPNINLRGLMCIPAPKETKDKEIQTFMKMNNLMKTLNKNGLSMDTLSMGMSDDMDSAIRCGSTIVRVGTAIFGKRQ